MRSNGLRREYYSSSKRSKPIFPESEVFRKFLPNENMYNNSKEKNIEISKTGLIPDYSNISTKINKSIKTVKNFFNYERYYFKEKKPKILETYSSFAKGLSFYLFGPKGKITSSELLRILRQKEKRIKLNDKIYAGALDLYTTLENYDSYTERLKNTIRKKIEISNNFETIKNIDGKIHSLYLKSKKKDFKVPSLSKRKNDIFLTTLQNNKTEENIAKSYKTYTKNFYKPPIKKNNKKNIFDRNLLLLRKNKRFDPSKTATSKFYTRSKSTFDKILKNKEKFKKDISSKIYETESPSVVLTKQLNDFFISVSRIHLKKEDKYKQDIQVIGRDHKKEYFENFNLRDLHQKLILDPKEIETQNSAPTKIHYSYYNRDDNSKSIIDFVKEMRINREKEKEKKYMKNIRQEFFNNWYKINKLGFELDDMRKNCRIFKKK